eukprot:scaffold22385_cov41-Attheya_sp.AAC.1
MNVVCSLVKLLHTHDDDDDDDDDDAECSDYGTYHGNVVDDGVAFAEAFEAGTKAGCFGQEQMFELGSIFSLGKGHALGQGTFASFSSAVWRWRSIIHVALVMQRPSFGKEQQVYRDGRPGRRKGPQQLKQIIPIRNIILVIFRTQERKLQQGMQQMSHERNLRRHRRRSTMTTTRHVRRFGFGWR